MGSGAHGGDEHEHGHGHDHADEPQGDDHAHGHGHSHGGDGEVTATATPFVRSTDAKDGILYYQAPDGRVLHSHDGCVFFSSLTPRRRPTSFARGTRHSSFSPP